ncbi:putative ankyrin repeat protein RF_0381 isoform X2 [Oscarella lobularis]
MAKFLISVGADIEALNKFGRTPFLEAAFSGAEGLLNVLIEKGCNIHAKDENGDGALVCASQNGHLKIGMRLIGLGLDVNEANPNEVTSLHWSCLFNHVEMAKFLISAGADIEALNKWGRTPFLEAAYSGAEGTLNVLIEKGCNIHAKSAQTGEGALGLASQKGHLKIGKRLVGLGLDVNEANRQGNTSLHRSCKNNHVEMAKFLISVGADIEALNKWGRTPFLEAAFEGAEGTLNVLIEKGCNIHAKSAQTGNGALGLASEEGHLIIVKQLVELGLDVNEANRNGVTSLHWACQLNHVELAKYLISAEADIEARNQWGRTPLLEAVFHGNVSVVDLLVKKGCNIDAKDNDGDGALQIADLEKHFKMTDLVKIFSQPRHDSEAESELMEKMEKILRLQAENKKLLDSALRNEEKQPKMQRDFQQPRERATQRIRHHEVPCSTLFFATRFRLDSFPADDELVPDELVKACAIVTGSKWEDIGMLLGISDSDLDDVRGSTTLARMIKVLDLWRKREESPTVGKLLRWFEQVDVNRRAIERKFDELYGRH